MKNKYNPSHKKVNLAGHIIQVDGKLRPKLNAPELMQYFLKKYAKPGDHVLLELKLKKPIRSEAQNNFYHLYLSLIETASGHSMDEIKAWVNEDILGGGIREVFGHETRIVGHSSDLNMSEFVEMMNEIMDRTEVPIPDPAPFKLPLTYDEYGKLKEEQKHTYAKVKAKKFIHK